MNIFSEIKTIRMCRIIIIIFLILNCNLIALNAQLFDYQKERSPSPNVSTFMAHDFSEADLYRGAPSLTIPIYKVKIGDFTLPISLSYNNDGMKLSEVSSGVGMVIGTEPFK